jgi:hypothetical protein
MRTAPRRERLLVENGFWERMAPGRMVLRKEEL